MKTHVLTGTKNEIVKGLEQIEEPIRQVIVLIDEPPLPPPSADEDMFAEMEPYTVQVGDADDSREAIYTRQEGE